MSRYRFLSLVSLLQHGFFIILLTTPAYIAVTRSLATHGVDLFWYQRVGLFALGVLFAMLFMMTPGLVVATLDRAGKRGKQ